jgi:hypothetical protein
MNIIKYITCMYENIIMKSIILYNGYMLIKILKAKYLINIYFHIKYVYRNTFFFFFSNLLFVLKLMLTPWPGGACL